MTGSEETSMETNEQAASGWTFVFVELGLWLACYLTFLATSAATAQAGGMALFSLGVVLAGLAFAVLKGFVIIQPNMAAVLVFLGSYRGTIRRNGFYWVNPLYSKQSVSLRIRNLDSDVLKVNDAAGNPVEIAAVINWRVSDTAKALFNVEAYQSFVDIQTETAVRHVASAYPYENYVDDGLSLRGNADEVTATLQHELQERLAVAGVDVLDTRLRRLAYAPEIAGEMLKRQQASAVVAARRLIVEGAVGMVDQALQMLGAQEIVELDEDHKATMVTNLLVVLCSDRGMQPVISSGAKS